MLAVSATVRAASSEGREGDAGGGRGGAGDEGAEGVAERFGGRAFLEQTEGLESERGEGGVRAAKAGAENDAGRVGEGVVQRETGEESQQERAADVDKEGPPGERALGAVLYRSVDEVSQRCAHSTGRDECDPSERAHGRVSDAERPTYLTTSTSSTMTSPSLMSSSSSARNAVMRSSVSTMTIAMGRSSESDKMRVVWMWLEAP